MILETIEPYLETINLILALVIGFFGLKVAFNLRGSLKSVWNYFLIAIVLFVVHEIVGSLAEFGVFEVEGLYALTEFIYILALLVSVIVFGKVIGSLSEKK